MSLEGARVKGCTNLCIGLNSAREEINRSHTGIVNKFEQLINVNMQYRIHQEEELST